MTSVRGRHRRSPSGGVDSITQPTNCLKSDIEELKPLQTTNGTRHSSAASLHSQGVTKQCCCTCTNHMRHHIHGCLQKMHCRSRMRKMFSMETLRQRLPVIKWLPNYTLNNFQGDLIAGITVGLTVIPQSLAYAKIAQLPPQYGLYSSFISCFVYCLLGTSKDVNLGPTAVMSLLTAEFGHSMIAGDATYAIALAFINGLVQISMGLLNLGFIVEFISHPVINSFSTAAAITIACSQLKYLFGLVNVRRGFVFEVFDTFAKLPETKLWDFCLGLVCLISLYLLKRLKDYRWKNTKLTGVLRLVVVKTVWITSTARNAIIVVLTTGLSAILYHNDIVPFSLTGNITGGIPHFRFPEFSLTADNVTYTATDAFSKMGAGLIVVPTVGLIEVIAVGKAFGRKNNYNINANQEFLALGTANLIGSFISAYPITASFSRSAVNDQSGSRTTAAGAFTGILVVAALAFLTPVFFYIPDAALAAVIIMAVTDMINFSLVRQLWTIEKLDLLPWFTAFLISLIFGFEYGIILGVIVSIVLLLVPWVRPPVKLSTVVSSDLIGDRPSTSFKDDILLMTIPIGIMFPGVEYLHTKIISHAINKGKAGWHRDVVVDLAHVHKLDYTAATGLGHLSEDFKKLKTWLVFINMQSSVEQTLKRAKVELTRAESLTEAVGLISSSSLADDDVMLKHVTASSSDLEAFAIDPSCIAYRSLLYKEQEEDRGSSNSDVEIVTEVTN